ncbi:recombinase family protein [Boudabousia liubingyangii]|uniref:recombinase family protein n=1 Tax=Boudabousia liubingyangii TaxID=1921764 RepID=UPI00093F583B|nr:recombinase family protein [Boudabousia liubingyangii]OKL48139.1 recombinase family protein [Boudabousia liubingyangii]
MAKTITAIPATKTTQSSSSKAPSMVRRVAAYARVSTDMEEQAQSYRAQIDYYTKLINSRATWQFAGMYSDEGISGTSTTKRVGFQNMIRDALEGKIDLIITKSVSRFARNTVDSLTTVRRLKDAGVEVWFEKENIFTFDSKGELLITIMSSLAQEESRSISENVTWGHRKRFADGKVLVPYSSLLGYKKGKDGNLAIDPEQAKVVRRIYAQFLSGDSPAQIAQDLTRDKIPTPRGKQIWRPHTIRSILTNEKYKGDALLQKTYTADFLTKTIKPNNGQVAQYYVHANHEAIIESDVWEIVQAKLAYHAKDATSYKHPFCGRVICGQCGSAYGRKVWHSGTKYQKHIWRCCAKYEKNTRCNTPHVSEEDIQEAFTQAVTSRYATTKGVRSSLDLIEKKLLAIDELKTRQQKSQVNLEQVQARLSQLITLATHHAISAGEYDQQYHQLESERAEQEKRYQELGAEIARAEEKIAAAKNIARYLENQGVLEYSDTAWLTLVEHATIHTDGTVTITFKDEH